MEQVAALQGVGRWSDSTPDHLLYLREIDNQIPESLFVHIIRDGRDVALSYAQLGWSRPLPWDRERAILVAGLYWKWIVGRGRQSGRALGSRYLEVGYERLVSNPRETLAELAGFIGQDLDYDRICKEITRVNTSFPSEIQAGSFSPVGRWKKAFSDRQVADFEALVGDCLAECRYPLVNTWRKRPTLGLEMMHVIYFSTFQGKHWLKNKTPLGRWADLSRIERA
jgi:hypothetical protein